MVCLQGDNKSALLPELRPFSATSSCQASECGEEAPSAVRGGAGVGRPGEGRRKRRRAANELALARLVEGEDTSRVNAHCPPGGFSSLFRDPLKMMVWRRFTHMPEDSQAALLRPRPLRPIAEEADLRALHPAASEPKQQKKEKKSRKQRRGSALSGDESDVEASFRRFLVDQLRRKEAEEQADCAADAASGGLSKRSAAFADEQKFYIGRGGWREKAGAGLKDSGMPCGDGSVCAEPIDDLSSASSGSPPSHDSPNGSEPKPSKKFYLYDHVTEEELKPSISASKEVISEYSSDEGVEVIQHDPSLRGFEETQKPSKVMALKNVVSGTSDILAALRGAPKTQTLMESDGDSDSDGFILID